MNLKQRGARYSAALRFAAGFAAAAIVVAMLMQRFATQIEIILAAALVLALILHVRWGFAMGPAVAEREMEARLAKRVTGDDTERLAEALTPLAGTAPADFAMLRRVKEALTSQRVDLWLQPIVSLPQRKPRFFEAYSRLREADGKLLKPGAYIDAAERANRIGVIDNLILIRCIKELRNRRRNDPRLVVFCNLSPATIFDPQFFDDFTDYLECNADLASNIVFEFTYPAVELMHPRVEANLQAIADRGFAFSVDHIQSLELDWATLRRRNFRYAKAPASLLLAETRGGEASAAKLANLRKRLNELGIDLIAEKIERETDMPEILSLGLDFGEGNLFGPARPAEFYLGDTTPTATLLQQAS